jgi:hypothetical protein
MKRVLRITAILTMFTLLTAAALSPTFRGAGLLLTVFAGKVWLLGLPGRLR